MFSVQSWVRQAVLEIATQTLVITMADFKASDVAFQVQKNFANKFFSNKTVATSMIDETSGNLLDNLYLLLYVFVSTA